MTRTDLSDAAKHLRTAADASEDDGARDRLTDLAGQLDRLAEADRGPDHGRLARIQTALQEIRGSEGEAVADAIDDARARISEYREGVEGV